MITLCDIVQNSNRPILGRCISKWAPRCHNVVRLGDCGLTASGTQQLRTSFASSAAFVRKKRPNSAQQSIVSCHQLISPQTRCLQRKQNYLALFSSAKRPWTSSALLQHTSSNTSPKAPGNTSSSTPSQWPDPSIIPASSATIAGKPPYSPPTTGLVSMLPARLIPYAELSRLSAPAGTLYLLLPCLFSTLLAGAVLTPPAGPGPILRAFALFSLGATAMRGAGCTINDLWDRNLDARVARTRLRPLARGAVSAPAALAWATVQTAAGGAALLALPAPCVAAAVPSLILVALYPAAKRVTVYPQAVLGVAFSWGALLGLPVLGVDAFPALTATLDGLCAAVGFSSNVFGAGATSVAGATAASWLSAPDGALAATALLYTSCILWTLVYDTIYAFQDIRDDRVAGIKSSAIAQAAAPRRFLSVLAASQVALLAGVGVAAGFGPAYFIGTVGGAGVTLGTMVGRVRLDDVSDCARWFRRAAWFTGAGIGCGFLAEWAVRLVKEGDVEEERVT